MGHARRHLTNGGHLAGLNELGFLLDAFGNVGGGHNQDIAVAVAGGADVNVDIKGLTAFAVVAFFGQQQGLAARHVLQAMQQFFVVFVAEVAKRGAHQFIVGVAVGVLGPPVDIQNCMVVAFKNKNGVRIAIEQGLVFLLGLDVLVLQPGIFERSADTVADQLQNVLLV